MNATAHQRSQAIDAQFGLANAWHARGNLRAAESGFKRVLRLAPNHMQACLKLGEVKLELGCPRDAVRYFCKALELEPHNADLRFRQNFLKDLLDGPGESIQPAKLPLNMNSDSLRDHPGGRINLNQQKRFNCHRSGWNYVLQALESVHNGTGVWFDGFVENNFAWKHWQTGKRDPETLRRLQQSGTFEHLATSEERGITPYRMPWIGCLHNPQNMPNWFHYQEAPQTIFGKPIWTESLEQCRGLFTFSNYHAEWLRTQTGKTVTSLIHPTEVPDRQFDFPAFLANPDKKIVQIGWWLRRLSAIYELPLSRNNVHGYGKLRLVPMFFDNADAYLHSMIQREVDRFELRIADEFLHNTREQTHLSNNEYDELLSSNVAFVYLYDANANNVVIECIARATPLLINPLPAVKEYLGDTYPFYFDNLPEAAEKVLDLDLIEQTHEYLKTCPTRAKLSQKHFLKSFIASEIYQAL
jgi:tetratricopeptide (TPR) repeat protein